MSRIYEAHYIDVAAILANLCWQSCYAVLFVLPNLIKKETSSLDLLDHIVDGFLMFGVKMGAPLVTIELPKDYYERLSNELKSVASSVDLLDVHYRGYRFKVKQLDNLS